MSKHSSKNLEAMIQGLNPQQRMAVTCIEGPLLIIAGAGSGKTGVITTRIAAMLDQGIPQASILALTFTNKAAQEMVARVKLMVKGKISQLSIATFHAFGLQMLRENHSLLGYRPRFTIYDNSDKMTCLKEASRELKLPYEAGEWAALAGLFSDIKTSRRPWDEITAQHKALYQEYHELMLLHNAVDFDDLIVKPLQLLLKEPQILDEYRQRYRYIMVDEFQDTSTIQYQLVRKLAIQHRNICCVGDDDQSIYSWRGADYSNIINFEKDFPECQEIKLERNYRSTGIILKAANAVIQNNNTRKEKRLWTEESREEMTLRFSSPQDDSEEASFIAETIGSLRSKQAIPYDQISILVRTNVLTKSLEDALLANNIPYKVSGGSSFFQRQEIKDMIAYLRVIENPDDNVNFLRIINTPRRGLGKSTLEILVNQAKEKEYSLYSAAAALVFDYKETLSDKIRAGLGEFIDLIERYREIFSEEKPALAKNFQELLEEIGYWAYLRQEFSHNEKIAKWRYENIQSFAQFLERWEKNPDNLNPRLSRWLNRITLSGREGIAENEAEKVNLMTIHASKGLEFTVVFLAGVEDGLIPHAKSIEENPQSIEEERRLFYVAITRARKRLYISACQTRKIRLELVEQSPSPFLQEIPQDLIDEALTQSPVETGEESKIYFANMPWKNK